MMRAATRSYIFTVEFRIAQFDRIWPVLKRHQESLVDLGARW